MTLRINQNFQVLLYEMLSLVISVLNFFIEMHIVHCSYNMKLLDTALETRRMYLLITLKHKHSQDRWLKITNDEEIVIVRKS